MTAASATSSNDASASSTVDSHLWHPFADMTRVRGREVVIERGEGVWLWDERGRRYLDASAGLWYSNIGHGRRDVRAAIVAQLERLETHHVFGDYATRPALELAERLSALAPSPDSRVFLLSGGGDGIDTAAKLARLFWARSGCPERRHVVSRSGGYHGTHGFGTSLAGIPGNREGFGELVPDTSTVEYDSVDALEREIERIGASRIAAFLFEPVMGSGGLLLPPGGYLEAVTELCRAHGILTIADSVVCGFGRLGTWFGVERWGLRPDLTVFAKGVTSGYLPLGGVLVAPAVAEPFWDESEGLDFRHGPTYAGHAVCCAAALANIDVLENERLLERSRELEPLLAAELAALLEHPLVGSVRAGVGLLGAFDFRADLLQRHPGLSNDALAVARAAGVLTRPLASGLAVSPPLVISEQEIVMMGERLGVALDHLERMLASDLDWPLDHGSLDALDHAFEPLTEVA